MSNVRLYGAESETSAPPQPFPPTPANPQATLTEAAEAVSTPTPMGVAATVGGTRPITLRRTGERPFRFRGSELCSAIGWAQKLSIWHEINLFRTTSGGIVVDIRVFRKSKDERDVFRVYESDSLDEAIGILEAYDPLQDIPVEVEIDNPNVALASLALDGIVLRQRIEQTRRQYEALLGDLLHEMERQR